MLYLKVISFEKHNLSNRYVLFFEEINFKTIEDEFAYPTLNLLVDKVYFFEPFDASKIFE